MGERMDDEQQRAERSRRKVALVVCGVVWVLTCTFVCVCVCVFVVDVANGTSGRKKRGKCPTM